MAYRRRYLSGQAATTVVIAEGAITTDKIVDKAVTQPKVADDAVTSDKIADETILSEDIKAGEVKTSDLGAGAVTTEKIADQAVTVSKLEASIQGIARPLTPGVATAEIADLAVTEGKLADSSVGTAKVKDGNISAAKLAANAVETVKVKDGAITTGKIAGGAVDQTKIGVGAVTGTEILNETVGAAELAANAVETVKIKDLNVTTAKLNTNAVTSDKILYDAVTEPKIATAALARRHINSFRSSFTEHGESFAGGGISNKWVKTLSIGGVVYQDNDKGLLIKSGTGAGWPSRIDFGGQSIGTPGAARPIMDVWITERSHDTFFTNMIALWKDTNNYIAFYANAPAGVPVNWFAYCRVGGVLTSVDTGVQVSTGIQLLSIDVVDATHVFFYINGIEVAEINTNIPDAVDVEPYLSLESREGTGNRTMTIKYVDLLLLNPTLP